jgi:predicted acetyltransferase
VIVAIEVRIIEETEAGDWVEALSTGFLRHPADGEAEQRRQGMYLDRTWAAFDGTRVAGTLRSFPTPFTVPGPAEVTAAGLTNVTVMPTHRRRGVLSQMITRDLTASAERGEPVSILIASEYPIYGRFGYGAAIESATYAVDASQVRFRTPSEGSIELVDAVTLRKEGPSIYDEVRAVQPGYIGRNDRWWDLNLRLIEVPGEEPRKAWQAIYRSPAGHAEGYVWYKVKDEWGDDMRPNALLTVEDLVAATPAAYHALWQFCVDVDWVTRIEAPDRSVDEALSWLVTNGRVVSQKSRFDFVWVRVLDISAALAARGYAAPGSVVIDVVDPLGLAAGRYLLDAGPDGAQCTPSDRAEADVTLPVSTLGSIYLGGYSLRTLAAAGLVDEHRPGAVATLDAMFRSPVTPWCSTWF